MPGTHQTPPPPPPRFVVGYDGSPESRVAVETAAHAAGPLGSVCIVVAAGAESAAVASLVRELEAGAIPALLTTQWSAAVQPGPPAEAILKVARERDATEIAIGTRGRGRAASLLGSVAHDVLHDADRPVRVITHRTAERLAHAPAALP